MSGTPAGGPVSAADSQELFERWRRAQDREARDELIARFLPLARKLARRYAQSSEPYDDLVQVASLGLVKAVERFDPDRGFAFTLVCGADDRRRAQALLPRHRLGDPRRPRRAGAGAQDQRSPAGDQRAHGPSADGRRARAVPRAERGGGARRAAGRRGVRHGLARRAARRRGGRDAASTRSATRTSGWGWSTTRRRSSPPPSTCPSASARSCSCGSVRTSPNRRSPSGSASRRCRSRGCCAGRCSACVS